jgi:hypothetical protein
VADPEPEQFENVDDLPVDKDDGASDGDDSTPPDKR